MKLKDFWKQYKKGSKKGFTIIEVMAVVAILAITSTATISIFLAVQDTVAQTGKITAEQYSSTQMEKYFRNQLQVASCLDVYTLSAGGLPDFEPSGYEPVKNDEFMYYKKASSTDPNDKNSIMFIRFDEDGGAKFHTVLMVDDVKDVSITICPIDYAKAYAGGAVDLSNMPFKFIYNIDATDYHYSGGIVLGNTRVEDGENLEYFNEVADSAGSKRNLVSLKWGSMANNDNNKCILFHSAETEVEEEPAGT